MHSDFYWCQPHTICNHIAGRRNVLTRSTPLVLVEADQLEIERTSSWSASTLTGIDHLLTETRIRYKYRVDSAIELSTSCPVFYNPLNILIMLTGRGGFTVNHHGTTFPGLSQAPVSLVVQAGLATSALLAPRLFSKGDYRHGELSRTLKSTMVGTGVALATLCSGVVLGTISGHHPERDPPFAYGGGTFSGATTTVPSDSMVRARATGSSVESGNAGGDRRSTLRSSCPSGQCPPVNHSNRVGSRRNGGGSDGNNNESSGSGSGGNNNESSGSGGNPSPPVVEEKAVKVASTSNAIKLFSH